MWIVAGNRNFYPTVTKFDTYEEAKIEFEELKKFSYDAIYLAEIKEEASDR